MFSSTNGPVQVSRLPFEDLPVIHKSDATIIDIWCFVTTNYIIEMSKL